MQKFMKNGKKGFTLVELLVVIAVLGIMAGIGLNSMGGITDIFRQRADEKTCDQIARVIEVRLLAGDYKPEIKLVGLAYENDDSVNTGDCVNEYPIPWGQLVKEDLSELSGLSQVTGSDFKVEFKKAVIGSGENQHNDLNIEFTSEGENGKTFRYVVKNVAYLPIN